MIKTFEQFINENYNETPALVYGQEYGSPLFDEISESLVSEINNSINEGRIVIEEGIFDSIGKLFKKGSDITKEKIGDVESHIENIKDAIDYYYNNGMLEADDIVSYGKQVKKLQLESNILSMVEDLYSSAEKIFEDLSEKEENTYKTISEKMTAANDAVKEFTEKAIAKIKEIIETSKNKVSDAISAVLLFCHKMAAFAKKAMVNIGKGAVIAFTLPFIFAYSVYKGAVSLCETLVEKAKEGAAFVKDSFVKIKDIITTWVSDTLTKAKETLKNACDTFADGSKKAYDAIGKAYLAIVGILGQLASDAKDKISNAYNAFIDVAKELTDEVKTFISDKWNIVSSWCKKTASSFAEGVKNVWEKTKNKVMDAVESVKDAYNAIEDEADATWNDIKEWGNEKQQNAIKAIMKYAVDKWGQDEVSSWI